MTQLQADEQSASLAQVMAQTPLQTSCPAQADGSRHSSPLAQFIDQLELKSTMHPVPAAFPEPPHAVTIHVMAAAKSECRATLFIHRQEAMLSSRPLREMCRGPSGKALRSHHAVGFGARRARRASMRRGARHEVSWKPRHTAAPRRVRPSRPPQRCRPDRARPSRTFGRTPGFGRQHAWSCG